MIEDSLRKGPGYPGPFCLRSAYSACYSLGMTKTMNQTPRSHADSAKVSRHLQAQGRPYGLFVVMDMSDVDFAATLAATRKVGK